MQHAPVRRPDTFLDPAEIISLTGKVRRGAQGRALKSMAIEHRVRPDGSIAVLRDHITKIFDGAPDSVQRKAKTVTPNWGAI